MRGPATLETVRRAVRGVVERTPELRGDAALRRRIAESMVRVCATAAGLMEEEDRLTDQIARRARASSSAAPPSASAADHPSAADPSAARSSAARSCAVDPSAVDPSVVDPSAAHPSAGDSSVDDSPGSADAAASSGAPAVAAGMAAAASGRPIHASAGTSAGAGGGRTAGGGTRARGGTMAAGLAAGDIHRRTAVSSAAGVLRSTRDAIDFPGFVTSLISGVFQAMTTSTIQQLQAYADLLGAVGMSTSQFASTSITTGRAMDWAAQRFPVFRVVVADGQPPRLVLNDGADLPDEGELRGALDATEEEVSTIDDGELEETLIPLVKRKLARERQAMLSTMLLMGMNRIVVDDGRIRASMELQVDARSTAEQTSAERFDSRVTTGGSASFGAGMWGASANMQATVGYVRSDDQFSREDLALRAGLRSSVDIGFHTEPIALNRMAGERQVQQIRSQSMNPAAEQPIASLLTPDERRTQAPRFDAIPQLTPTPAPDPNSEEARNLRRRQNFTVSDGNAGANSGTSNAGANPGASNPGASNSGANPGASNAGANPGASNPGASNPGANPSPPAGDGGHGEPPHA
jgi:hypothetical protein